MYFYLYEGRVHILYFFFLIAGSFQTVSQALEDLVWVCSPEELDIRSIWKLLIVFPIFLCKDIISESISLFLFHLKTFFHFHLVVVLYSFGYAYMEGCCLKGKYMFCQHKWERNNICLSVT